MKKTNHPAVNTNEKIARFYLEDSNGKKRWNFMDKTRMKKIFTELEPYVSESTKEQIKDALIQL